MIIIPFYREKVMFPSWSEYSACENGSNLTPRNAATKSHTGVGVASQGFTSNLYITHAFVSFQTPQPPFFPFCLPRSTEHIVPFSCNLNWNYPSLFECAQRKLASATTPLEKTICIWLQVKHAVSLAQSAIEQQQSVAPRLVWKGLDSILSRIWQIIDYLYSTKGLLNSDMGLRLLLHILFYLPCCYQALEVIYEAIPTKACIYRLKWHMQLQGHCLSPQSS